MEINKLINSGVVTRQARGNKPGIDLNNDGVIKKDELIRDVNHNGSIDGEDALDFIVNNVTSLPTIVKVKLLLGQEIHADADSASLQAKYLFLLNQILTNRANAEPGGDQALVEILGEQSTIHNEISVKQKEIGDLNSEIFKHGIQPLEESGRYYLPTGELVSSRNVQFDQSGDIYSAALDEPAMISLPDGQQVLAEGTIKYESGKLSAIEFSAVQSMVLPNGSEAQVVAVEYDDNARIKYAKCFGSIEVALKTDDSITASEIWFHENGEPERVRPAKDEFHSIGTLTLPTGQKVNVDEYAYPKFNSIGQVIVATLEEPITFTLPTGDFAKIDAISYNDDGELYGVRLTEPTEIKLSDGNRVRVKDTLYFTDQGNISSMMMDGTQLITLPSGEHVNACYIYYDQENNQTEYSMEPTTMTLPSGDRSMVRNVTYSTDGKITQVILSEPMMVTINGNSMEKYVVNFTDPVQLSTEPTTEPLKTPSPATEYEPAEITTVSESPMEQYSLTNGIIIRGGDEVNYDPTKGQYQLRSRSDRPISIEFGGTIIQVKNACIFDDNAIIKAW